MDTFEQFRNNVFCRRPINQRKAKSLWPEIQAKLSEDDKKRFTIEWSHFMLGEFDAHEFAFHFDKHVKKYFS